MSVAGIDLGNDCSCVAIARKRGIDVLLNRESNRETPAVVNFGDKMRFLGTDGSAKMGLAPQNTVHQVKRLLGRKFADPAVQQELARLPYRITEAPDGSCLVHVTFQNEPASFTPEQLAAMVLVDQKKIAEAETGVPPVDCVLSVPVYFSEAQRYALLNAAAIAGLNCLRLLNETTATALAYGIFKTDLPDTTPVHVAFVDVGHSSTQVAIVSLRKGGLQMRAHAWDEDLGGRDFDQLLFDHFADEFKTKFKIDVRSNKKASLKLRTQVEKVKRILSANPEAPLNIECIMEDTDVRGMATRELLEGLAAPMVERFQAVVQKALSLSGLAAEALSSVEVVGSSTRIPMLNKVVEDVLKKTPSRTMHAKECVSRGAALQCAMLSPVFKVREFEVMDCCPYPVDFKWERDGKPTTQRVFEVGSPFPATKSITFLRSAPFAITAVNGDSGETLGTYQIGPFSVPAGSETAKLKVKVRMNLHGLVGVESAQAVEEATPEAPAAAAQPAENGAPAADAPGPAPMDTDGKGTAVKKAKVRKAEVPVASSSVAGLSQQQLNEYFEKECQMQATDRLQEETADRKNAVEAYVYKLRNGLYGPLASFVRAEQKDDMLAKLQAVEDWLYDEGEDCSKSVYIAKLDELKQLCGPVELRASELEARPAAAAALRTAAQGYLQFAQSAEPRFAHISAEERAPIANEAQAALNWLNEKEQLQAGLAKHEPPVLMSSDCQKKVDVLDRLARPVVNRPPPKASPAKPEPAPPSAAEATEAEPTPMDSETPSDGPAGSADAAMES